MDSDLSSAHLMTAIEAMFAKLSTDDRIKIIIQLRKNYCLKCGVPDKQHGDYCGDYSHISGGY